MQLLHVDDIVAPVADEYNPTPQFMQLVAAFMVPTPQRIEM